MPLVIPLICALVSRAFNDGYASCSDGERCAGVGDDGRGLAWQPDLIRAWQA